MFCYKNMSIEIEHISKFYGTQEALSDLSFSVNPGQMVGFLGPNGAGKSTLMRIVAGYLMPTSGVVRVCGDKVTPDNTMIKRLIGYLPENNPLYSDLYVTEYLEMAAGFYHIPNRHARIMEMIELTGLGHERHKKIGTLSKGYRQRVGLAQALIHNPQVLILDEPTSGLDPNQLADIRLLITEAGREKTVILSSHILAEIEAMCSRAVIINRGQKVADSPIEGLKSAASKGRQKVRVIFDRNINAAELLTVEGVDSAETSMAEAVVFSSSENDVRPALFRFAVENQCIILEMQQQQENFEAVFRQLTQPAD